MNPDQAKTAFEMRQQRNHPSRTPKKRTGRLRTRADQMPPWFAGLNHEARRKAIKAIMKGIAPPDPQELMALTCGHCGHALRECVCTLADGSPLLWE